MVNTALKTDKNQLTLDLYTQIAKESIQYQSEWEDSYFWRIRRRFVISKSLLLAKWALECVYLHGGKNQMPYMLTW